MKLSKEGSPTILEISDYRDFLCTYAEEKKLQSKVWNLSMWARTLGLKSTSSITKILSGERKPGPDLVDRLVRYFKFNAEEERHFRSLVLLDKDKNASAFRVLLERTKQKESTLQSRVLELFEFRLIAEWHHLSVRELFRIKDFKLDLGKIRKLFKTALPVETIEKSISLLQRLALIQKSERGTWVAVDQQVLTQNDVPNEAIRLYHEQMLEQAKARLQDTDAEERDFQALTLLIDRERLPELKHKIREFIQAFESEGGSKRVNQLYQLQFQLFPITEKFEKYQEFYSNKKPTPGVLAKKGERNESK